MIVDPEFRKALREIGAPEWYPQDAPIHTVTGSSEQNEDGTWLSKLVCPICNFEKHFVSGKNGSMETVNEGDRWALHGGGTEGIEVTGVEAQQHDDRLDVFEEFLK